MQPRVFLAPGASGNASSMQPYVDALVALGVDARAVDVPKGRAERAVPAFVAAVPPSPDAVPGGRSYGGRVASLAASEAPYAGLILISYPLHLPGRPETAAERTAHWPSIQCPVLLLAGDSDPFARLDLVRDATGLLRDAELVVFARGGHGLMRERDDVAEHIARFVSRVG